MESNHHREPWNKGKLIGQKPPLKPKDIWTIRINLQNAPLPNTSRPGLSWPVLVSSTARATTTPQGLMSARRFANIWNAASLRTALSGPGVMTAGTTTLSPFPAKAVASAPRAIPGAWWRRRHTWRIKSYPPAGTLVGTVGPEAAALLLWGMNVILDCPKAGIRDRQVTNSVYLSPPRRQPKALLLNGVR
jgi:hypothetical protein